MANIAGNLTKQNFKKVKFPGRGEMGGFGIDLYITLLLEERQGVRAWGERKSWEVRFSRWQKLRNV